MGKVTLRFVDNYYILAYRNITRNRPTAEFSGRRNT